MVVVCWAILAVTFLALTRSGPALAQPAAKAPAANQNVLTLVNGRPGFWHLARDARGVWWFVSPDGRPEFLNSVTTVQPHLYGRNSAGPHFVSTDWADTGSAADLDRWAGATVRRVRDAGFKGMGAWSHPVFHGHDVPITKDLNVSTWTWGESRRVFSPQWAATVERVIAAEVTPLRDNRNLVGYYVDNELDWETEYTPSAYFDGLASEDPNRQQVVQVIRSLWASVEAFNRDWKAKLTDWSDLSHWDRLPVNTGEGYGKLHDHWLHHVARAYFEMTTGLVRKYDPNHLVLGVRFRGYAPPQVVRASKGLTDAQSINLYPGRPRVNRELFERMYELSGGQPVVVSEYSFHALDGRSGNRNTFGFPGQVKDQQARADHYRLYTSGLAELPFVVGADWFQWMDEPPSGRLRDGEDVNFGVVDVYDRPYDLLAGAIRATTPRLNALHAASGGTPADAAPVFADAPMAEAVAQ